MNTCLAQRCKTDRGGGEGRSQQMRPIDAENNSDTASQPQRTRFTCDRLSRNHRAVTVAYFFPISQNPLRYACGFSAMILLLLLLPAKWWTRNAAEPGGSS